MEGEWNSQTIAISKAIPRAHQLRALPQFQFHEYNKTLILNSSIPKFFSQNPFLRFHCPKISQTKTISPMCPLRFILVFFSAVLAGYIAWRSASSSSSSSDIFRATEASDRSPPVNENQRLTDDGFGLKRTIQNGFWIFVDMASGRFLWRNLNASSLLNKNHQVQAEKIESN